MVKKAIFLILSLGLIASFTPPIHAADLVAIPQTVRPPVLSPAPVQTHSAELSFKSFEAKISNVLKPEKTKPKLAATDDSGSVGNGFTYTFTAADRTLVISGSGQTLVGGRGCNASGCLPAGAPWSSYCDYIEYITLDVPSGSASLEYAVAGCRNLISIIVNSENGWYKTENGVLFNKSGTQLLLYPAGKSGRYSIPNSVTDICTGAFDHCTGLTSVTIPNSVTYIGNFAFPGCSGLSSITIPDSVTYIGSCAFSRCSGLNSITIPDSVTYIGGEVFEDCTSLTSLTYKGTSDPGYSSFTIFWGCNKLYCVLVPSSYTSDTFCGHPVVKGNDCPAPTRSRSPSKSPSRSRSQSRSRSRSQSRSRSPMATPSKSPSRSRSPMATPSRSPMATPTPTPTAKFTAPVNYFHRKLNGFSVFLFLYNSLVQT